MRSKRTILFITIGSLIILDLILIYQLNLCYSVKEDEQQMNSNINEIIPNEVKKHLPLISFPQKLNVVVFLNEQSCNFCNNHVLMHIKQLSNKFPKNIILFISGSGKFYKTISNNFKLTNAISVNKLDGRYDFTNPICLLLDSKNNTILTLEADIRRMAEINNFFEKVSLILNVFYIN